MQKVQIICTKPGMRRVGIAHPASAFYDADRWTDKQLEAFRADSAFTVREVDSEAENVLTDTDFKLAVDAEVRRQLGAKMLDLHASFSTAVEDAVIEKTAALKSDHDNALDAAGRELKAAQEKVEALEAEVKKRTLPPPTKK